MTYGKEQLRDAVVELLVTQPRKCVTELKAHLQKTTQSYKQLVLELIEGKDMKVAIFSMSPQHGWFWANQYY